MTSSSSSLNKWRAERRAQTNAAQNLQIKTARSPVRGGAQHLSQSSKIRYQAAATAEAKRDLQKLKDAGILEPDDKVAEAAMLEVLTVMRSNASAPALKLQAAKTLLDFTKSKPVAKSEVTVNAAEAWLASLDDK